MYFGGYSSGGSFTWDVACEMSDRIAAVAPVAASMWYPTFENCDAAAPTAVCHILGTDDFYAPYEGGWVPSAAEQHAFWVQKNQSNPTPETVNLGGGVTRLTWAEGKGCHGVQHFRIQNGGHDHPPFTPEVVWEFVSQYSLDGVIGCGDQEITGDLNGDGVVDGGDIGIFLTFWNTNNPIGDLDGNGIVEGADLGILLLNWSP